MALQLIPVFDIPSERPKLSALLRAGSEDYAQITGDYIAYTDDRCVVGLCAVGTIFYALFRRLPPQAHEVLLVNSKNDVFRTIYNHHPEAQTERAHPIAERAPQSVLMTIIDLNDDYHWSRQRIAEWLESEGL